MSGELRIDVIFDVPECTALYVAMQERRARRFDCTICGMMIHAWSGAYDYPIWRIYPDAETLAGGRYRAHVSVAKDRQCPMSRKETGRE